jgi:hypothetical protein
MEYLGGVWTLCPWCADNLVRVSNAASIPDLRRSRSATPFFDPGWLFIVSGLALLGACVLLPAKADVESARFHRDEVLRIEDHRAQRIARYEEYIGAVESRQPQVLLALAESQLNQIPADRGALPIGQHKHDMGSADASVFPALEPAPFVAGEYTPVVSRLEGLVTSERTRKWVMLVGLVGVLVGMVIGLPRARGG